MRIGDNSIDKDFFGYPPQEVVSNSTVSNLSYKSYDGLNLAATMLQPKGDSAFATVILIHGIRARKEYQYNLCEEVLKLNCNCVAVDLRAHGESEGIFTTFGVKEKRDVSGLIDYLQANYNISHPIGIWGQSLGGAVALQAMANDQRIEFGIVESTFSNYNKVVHSYAHFTLGFDIPFVTNYLLNRAATIAEFDSEQANPEDICKNINQPILLMHGLIDDRINVQNAHIIFKELASNSKKLVLIPNAKHVNLIKIGGEHYLHQIDSFVNRNVKISP